ncbi:hypothetical protein ACSVBT_06900 [Afipia sp. TerB]
MTAMRNIVGTDPRELAAPQEIIKDLAEHLVTGRQDPSDPDAALEFLLDLDLYRPSTVAKHFDEAFKECGQIYIARDISRRAA